MNLTPHFTLEEFLHSEYADRHSLNNSPPAYVAHNLRALAQTMELVRALFDRPVHISSGYRSFLVNRGVGGASGSAHTLGLACDFLIPGVLCYDVAKRIEESSIQYDQLILEYGWIHIAIVEMRRESLTKRSSSAPYEKGLQK